MKKHIYLLITLFFSVTSLLIYTIKKSVDTENKQIIYDEIRLLIENEEKNCVKEIERVVNYLENDKNVNFTSIGTNFKHPILIFKGTSLVVWTSTKFPTNTHEINLKKPSSFYNQREEKFICITQKPQVNKEKYTVVGLIPIVKKYKIQNDYLKTEYNPAIFQFKNFFGNFFEYESTIAYSNYYSKNKDFLFSLNLPEKLTNNDEVYEWLLFFSVSFLLMAILLYAYALLSKWLQKFSETIQISVWIFFIVSVRLSLLLFKYPISLKNFKVFQTKYFSNLFWCPSLGDLLLHTLAVFCILFVLFNKIKKPQNYFNKFSNKLRLILTIVLVLLVQFFYKSFFDIVSIVNSNFEYEINILQNITINSFKIVSWFIYLTTCLIFFLVFQIVFRIFADLTDNIVKNKVIKVLLILIVGTILFMALQLSIEPINYMVCGIGFIHFLVIYSIGLYKTVRKINYMLYTYMLISITSCALIGSWAIIITENEKDIQQKNLYSTNLMLENDLYGEFLLQEASDKIKKDLYVLNAFNAQNQEFIEQKINNVYIGRYLDKYELSLSFFDESGISLNPSITETYQNLSQKFQQKEYKTDYENVFFVNSKLGSSKYFSFIEIINDQKRQGYLVLEFANKKIMSKSVYPTLLLDKRFSQNFAFPNYSFATYSNDSLMVSSGNFIYRKHFIGKLLNIKFTNDQNKVINNYKHYLTCINHKCIVVSSPDQDVNLFISNFSFLFIIQLFVILSTIAYYFVYIRVTKQLINYSTKIQIYLNIAFILPLIVVTFVFMFITIKNYNDDLNTNFNALAIKVSSRLSEHLEEYKTNRINPDKLKSKFTELSQNFDIDINLYDKKGVLLNSSQPHVFDDKIISEYINPVAYSEIIEKKKKSLVLNENLGNFNYYNVYTSLKSQKTGLIQGIVSIPFYETKIEIQKKLINVIVTIFNIFVVVFILFVVVSHYVIKTITFPIEQLKVNMQNVSLQKENEIINWTSKDEIGQLVDEYNKMIYKLKESKELLTQTEKETAWREMAKQVSHEIKNPLTPMKLNLQYLEMMIHKKVDADTVEKITNNTIKVMLEQIETLSEIATSFSNFAKMPSPKLERYNVYDVVKSICDLYIYDTSLEMKFEYNTTKIFAIGDKELMGRIVNNLIINGKQSVSQDSKPRIHVLISTDSHKTIISVNDNGLGIPEDIQDKVFLPNFSTKYTGSGIGLAMAKQGIDFFGGKIYFKTALNVGTTFYIELPQDIN